MTGSRACTDPTTTWPRSQLYRVPQRSPLSFPLGTLAVEALPRRAVPPSQIVATGRDIAGIKDLADRGVVVRRAEFADPDSLAAAFAGADKLLLISASIPVDERLDNHRRAIDAALAAGVSLVVYTSMVHADTATTILAATHRATEKYLRECEVSSVLLRNSWYLENYTDRLPQILQSGTVIGAVGQGRVSAASRADYAEAAAVVLTTEGHAGAVYELGGDEAFNQSELAAEISAAAGRRITYTDLPAPKLIQVLAHRARTGAAPPQSARLSHGRPWLRRWTTRSTGCSRWASRDQRGLERNEAPAVGLSEPHGQRATAHRPAHAPAGHLDGHPAEHTWIQAVELIGDCVGASGNGGNLVWQWFTSPQRRTRRRLSRNDEVTKVYSSSSTVPHTHTRTGPLSSDCGAILSPLCSQRLMLFQPPPEPPLPCAWPQSGAHPRRARRRARRSSGRRSGWRS